MIDAGGTDREMKPPIRRTRMGRIYFRQVAGLHSGKGDPSDHAGAMSEK